MPFYDKLLVNRDWDIAVLFIKDQQPMPIECKACSVEVFEDCLKLRMSVGPHPFDKTKTAASEHYIPLEDIKGVSYYTESKIVSKPSISIAH